MFDNEIWKSVREYEGLYEISDSGILRSIRIKNGVLKYRIIKGSVNQDSSISHAFVKNNVKTSKAIHKIVAEAFINKTSTSLDTVYHLDKNKQNNHVSNLKWEDKVKYCKTCDKSNEIIRFCLVDQCSNCYEREYRKKHYNKPRILNPICEGCKKSRSEVKMQTGTLCRTCYNKQYYQNNIEKEALRHKKRYDKNQKLIAEKSKKYRSRPEVAERIKRKKDEWRKANKEYELQKSREYKRQPNYRQKISKEKKEKYRNDIQYNINARVRGALNQCLNGKNGQKED